MQLGGFLSYPRSRWFAAFENGKSKSRHTVALAPAVASDVERYAQTTDTSMSKAIAALVDVNPRPLRHAKDSVGEASAREVDPSA